MYILYMYIVISRLPNKLTTFSIFVGKLPKRTVSCTSSSNVTVLYVRRTVSDHRHIFISEQIYANTSRQLKKTYRLHCLKRFTQTSLLNGQYTQLAQH